MTAEHPESWPFRPWMRAERGGRPESYHEGILVVADDEGNRRASWGDPDWPAYLRSSLKMIQALPLVESGAADAFGLGPRELAVTCASHDGTPAHVEAVTRILGSAGLGLGHLRCGPHAPFDRESHEALVRRAEAPGRVHNNCSGKHAGMLATCAHRGWDTATYPSADHPLQREIAEKLGALTDLDPESLEYAVDGCGVPTFRVSLHRFAVALARFASAGGASRRLFDAMNRHADMVAGTSSMCTELARAANRPVIAKAGAEGLYGVAWRDDSGRGVALVAKDAAGHARGRNFAVTEAVRQLGLLDADGVARMAPFHSAPLRNHGGDEVGRMVGMFDLLGG